MLLLNEVFISNSDNELQQIHLDLNFGGIVCHIEARHSCPLKGHLSKWKPTLSRSEIWAFNGTEIICFRLQNLSLEDRIRIMMKQSKPVDLLVRDLLVQLRDKPHVLLLSVFFHPQLFGGQLLRENNGRNTLCL